MKKNFSALILLTVLTLILSFCSFCAQAETYSVPITKGGNNIDNVEDPAACIIRGTTVVKNYATLQVAISEAVNGDTVKLLKDVNLGSTKHLLQINKDITLDLNGKTITGSDLVESADGATARVTNGTIVSYGGASCVGVNSATGILYVDHVCLSGYNAFYSGFAGTHTYLGEGNTCSNLGSLYSSNGSGILHITDGLYEANVLDCSASATAKDKIFITGGCFYLATQNTKTVLEKYVANGYHVVECTHGRANHFDVVPDTGKMVVELIHIDATGKESVVQYAALQDAIKASANGDTLRLILDITENANIPSGKNIILNLNGKTVTAKNSDKPVISNSGTLILMDSKGGGSLTGGSVGLQQNGTLFVGGKLNLTGSGNTNGGLYLPIGKIVSPAAAPYAPDSSMKLSITTEVEPAVGDPVTITDSNNSVDISSYFESKQGYDTEDIVDGGLHRVVFSCLRKITLTSASASKIYDGSPLTKPQVMVTDGSLKDGDTIDIICTAGLTEVGCAVNNFTYQIQQTGKIEYEVACVYGMLTVGAPPSENIKVDTNQLADIARQYHDQNPTDDVNVFMTLDTDVTSQDMQALQSMTNQEHSVYYNANLYAVINGTKYDIGDDNEAVIGVTSIFDYNARQDIHVYRLHNGRVDELTATPNDNSEYISFNDTDDTLTVFASKYSAYCITWTGVTPQTGDNTPVWLYACLGILSIGAFSILSRRKRRG